MRMTAFFTIFHMGQTSWTKGKQRVTKKKESPEKMKNRVSKKERKKKKGRGKKRRSPRSENRQRVQSGPGGEEGSQKKKIGTVSETDKGCESGTNQHLVGRNDQSTYEKAT